MMQPADLDRLWREARATVRSSRAERLASLPERARFWLALAPQWTPALLKSTGVFPDDFDVLTVLRDLEENGVCEHRAALPAWGVDEDPGEELDVYAMSRDWREFVIDEAIAAQGRGLLLEHMVSAGEAVVSAAQSDPKVVPHASRRWAELAQRARDPLYLQEVLLERVREFVEEGHSGEAFQWIVAARDIENALGSRVSLAVESAARTFELLQRAEDDQRKLAHFIERPAQIAAFDRLASGDDDHWALHYLGAGGVGKTMLVRHLVARYIPERIGGVGARLDFDYLNPDYPLRQPGLLIGQLVEELRLQDTEGRAEELFSKLRHEMLTLHESLSEDAETDPDVVAGYRDRMVQTFSWFLAELGRPVVLVLDTCEELARMRPDGTVPRAVVETFAMLERLHELVPSVRVVFSGRRPLARSGADWSWEDAPKHTDLPPRPYLLLHELRGFDDDEARGYLARRPIDRPALVEAILDQCRTTIEQTAKINSPESDRAGPRYSPLELSMYAEWAEADPELSAESIAATGHDRYVELRIAGRIRNASLRALFPAVALLGRFDRETLRAAMTTEELDEPGFAAAFDELDRQEWITREASGFRAVQEGLRDRLLRFVLHERARPARRARRRLLDFLEPLTRSGDRSRLDPDHFDQVLRFGVDEPERQWEWWTDVRERWIAAGDWNWLETITDRALASSCREPEGAEAPHPLRVSLLADNLSARLKDTADPSARYRWNEILSQSQGHPVAEERRRLGWRAIALSVVGGGHRSDETDASDLAVLLQARSEIAAAELDEQLAAALVAAVEALVERWERGARAAFDLQSEPPSVLNELVETIESAAISPELRSFAGCLGARIQRSSGALDAARRRFLHVLEVAPSPGATSARWLDWNSPDDLGSRLRLEVIRGAWPDLVDAAHLPRLFDERGRVEPSMDLDRYVSAQVALASSLGADVQIGDRFSMRSTGTPQTNAHRDFPASEVALAEARAWADPQGLLESTLRRLNDFRGQAESASRIEDALEADRARARLARGFRAWEQWNLTFSSLHYSGDPEDAALAWVIDGLSGVAFERPDDANWRGERQAEFIHARWQTAWAGSEEELDPLLEFAREVLDPSALDLTTFPGLACALDGIEANVLAARHGREPVVEVRPDLGALLESWIGRGRATQTLRLTCRYRALAAGEEIAAPPFPRRLAARILLDEAEKLALRLPDTASPLFEASAGHFREAQDRVGEFLSTAGLALAAVRGRALDRVADLLPVLARALEELAGVSLESLSTGAGLSSADVPAAWAPYARRLAACVIPTLTAGAQRAMYDGLRSLYPQRLPAELRWIEELTPRRRRASRSADEPAAPAPQEARGGQRTLRGPRPEPPPAAAGRLPAEGEERALICLRIPGAKGLLQSEIEAEFEVPFLHRNESFSMRPLADLEDAARSIPESLLQAMEDAAPRRREVWLRLFDLRDSWPAWEGLLNAALAARGLGRQRFLRTLPRELRLRTRTPSGLPPFSRPEPGSSPLEVQVVAADREIRGLLAEAWSSSLALGDVRADEDLETLGDLAPHMVHIIGQGIETTRGVRLSLSGAASRETRGGRIYEGSEIIEAVAHGERTESVILQLPPKEKYRPAAREEIARLRALGAELCQLGCPFVVILPSLPSPSLGRSAEPIARAAFEAGDWHELERGFLEALEQLRETISEVFRGDPRGEREAPASLSFYTAVSMT